MGEISAKQTTSKGFISKIYKQRMQFYVQKQPNQKNREKI